eukprot:2675594-Rhodomonas_salina.1
MYCLAHSTDSICMLPPCLRACCAMPGTDSMGVLSAMGFPILTTRMLLGERGQGPKRTHYRRALPYRYQTPHHDVTLRNHMLVMSWDSAG